MNEKHLFVGVNGHQPEAADAAPRRSGLFQGTALRNHEIDKRLGMTRVNQRDKSPAVSRRRAPF